MPATALPVVEVDGIWRHRDWWVTCFESGIGCGPNGGYGYDLTVIPVEAVDQSEQTS